MKILFTGASGRIGRYLTKALAQHQLVCLSRDEFNNDAALHRIFSEDQPEVVIHLASVLAGQSEKDPELAKAVNVDRTALIAEIAKKTGAKKFIFTSTAAVYSQVELKPISEAGSIKPLTVYAQTKKDAEDKIRNISNDSQTNFIIFRVFNIYGPRFNDSLVNKLVTSSSDKPAVVLGPDNYYRDYIHIRDVADAVGLAIASPKKNNFTIFNIGSGKAISNTELVNELKKSGIKPCFTVKESQPNISWADITAAKNQLNFCPSQELDVEGIV